MKEKIFYVCAGCGYQSIRWLGKCPNCGEWNSFTEEFKTKQKYIPSKLITPKKIDEITDEQVIRTETGIGELDRVLGGGLVKGSLILLAGEPGVGKSTLLLSAAGKLAEKNKTVLYVSGEESLSQIKIRSKRLSISSSIYLLSTTEMPSIKESLNKMKPDLIIIDSIQAVFDPEVPTVIGSVTQIRENTNFFMNFAKKTDIPVILIGHITKEGLIAGPKIMEHIVDVVLYFEGDVRSNLRILRSTKNRFGSTTEIGVFSMEETGLKEIPEASSIFLLNFQKTLPGAVIFPAQEGTRTIFVEIQSLVTPTYYGIPKRSVIGPSFNRVSLVLAVLEKKLHFNFGTYDVYVNAGGGLKIEEPGCDLPIAISCVSSLKEIPPIEESIYMGEIALTGEIRPISQINLRLKEAERIGFKKAIVPKANLKEIKNCSLKIFSANWLKEVIEISLKI